MLVVDDHELVRVGISQFLANQPEIAVVGTAGDGASAVTEVARLHPDVVLVDLAMPVMDGVESTRQILLAAPATRILVLTSFSDRDRILDAIGAGAMGYLLKDSEPSELLRGIEAAARGESPLSSKAAQAIISERKDRELGRRLSPRETEVLVLVANGLLNKQVAQRLGISEKSVKAHLIGPLGRTPGAREVGPPASSRQRRPRRSARPRAHPLHSALIDCRRERGRDADRRRFRPM